MPDGPDLFVPDATAYGGLRVLPRRDDRSALALQELDHARRASEQPEPTLDRAACPRHPEWQPPRRGPQPLPSATMCPVCRDEATPAAGQPEVEVRAMPGTIGLDPRLDRAYEAHREKMRATGQAVSGSVEEQEALDAIAAAREVERERDARKFGREPSASQRIIGGDLVTFPHGRAHLARRAKARAASHSAPVPTWRGPDSDTIQVEA